MLSAKKILNLFYYSSKKAQCEIKSSSKRTYKRKLYCTTISFMRQRLGVLQFTPKYKKTLISKSALPKEVSLALFSSLYCCK